MKHLIDGVGFSERAHFDCTEQAFEVVLRYHGYVLEDVLFDEWRFNYWKADPPQAGYAVNAGDPIDRARKFAEFGVELLFRHRDTPAAAVDGIKRLVSAGKPVPVWVDPYHLSYYAKKNHRHTVHAIVVVGYDDEADTVHVVDPSPWQMYRGQIDEADLAEAMSSEHHAHVEERNSWVEFDYPRTQRWHTPKALLQVLAANTGAMLADMRMETAADGVPTGTLHQGVAGMRAFAGDVAAWGEIGDEGMTVFMQGGREQLQAIARRRYGHARFLASAAGQLRDDRLEQAAQRLEVLAEAWFLPANMLFKGSRRRPLEMLPKVARRLKDLADREEALVEGLREVVESC